MVSGDEIIYSEGFSDCDISISDREMICDVGFEVLWTLQQTASNSHRIENGAFVLGNKGDGNARTAQTVIDVFDFEELELNVQIVSPPGSQGEGDFTKCRVVIDNVVQVGVRQGVTDVFKFSNIVPQSDTIIFKLENDKDRSKGPCEFDDFVLTGQTVAPTGSPTIADVAAPAPPPSNITREGNQDNNVIPILAPTFAILGMLSVIAILLLRRKRRSMHDNCDDMTDSELGNKEGIVSSTRTDVKYRRGGIRIKRTLNADYIKRANPKELKETSEHDDEGRSESPRSHKKSTLRRTQSSEETQESDATNHSRSPLGPSVEYLKRIELQAHKSIFRPSSAFLQKASRRSERTSQQRDQFSSRHSYPRESIEHDIDV